MDLTDLVEQIRRIHDRLALHASKAVNVALTVRNWLIGCHIHEYELSGEDRGRYGAGVIDALADRLARHSLANCNRRQLYRYLDFYRRYPQIVGTLSPQFRAMLPAPPGVENVGAPTPQSTELAVPPEKLVETLSYSHLELLAAIDDPLKRAFYEVESVRGVWAVRELKRQIASLAYERTGLSHDKPGQLARDQAHVERHAPELAIRDPYVFEFLGLAPRDVMPETRLEHALLDELEAFLLELGRGFCFEARQRRILIGDEHFFVDLVFYHRILKCHVLIELKSDGFRHEYLGQLNAYVSWYREHEISPGDNPPVGILLCTEKNHALVRYALAGMESQLFVSKYRLALPDEAEMREFIEARLEDEMAGSMTDPARDPTAQKPRRVKPKKTTGTQKRRNPKQAPKRSRRRTGR